MVISPTNMCGRPALKGVHVLWQHRAVVCSITSRTGVAADGPRAAWLIRLYGHTSHLWRLILYMRQARQLRPSGYLVIRLCSYGHSNGLFQGLMMSQTSWCLEVVSPWGRSSSSPCVSLFPVQTCTNERARYTCCLPFPLNPLTSSSCILL
jgi:hypothetical protein